MFTRPLTPADWPALETLFGPRGACGGCWCMYWRTPGGKAWKAATGAPNRARFEALVRGGQVHGVLAFEGSAGAADRTGAPGTTDARDATDAADATGAARPEDAAPGAPVGWCAIGPRADFVRLASSRVLARAGTPTTWCLNCLFIPAQHRGKGVATALVAAATRHAFALGASEVEAYPVEVGAAEARVPAAFAWTGVPALFSRVGYTRAEPGEGRGVWVCDPASRAAPSP